MSHNAMIETVKIAQSENVSYNQALKIANERLTKQIDKMELVSFAFLTSGAILTVVIFILHFAQ